MLQKLSQAWERVFPERHIVVQTGTRMWRVVLPGPVQAVLSSVLVLAVGSAGAATFWTAQTREKLTAEVDAIRAQRDAAEQEKAAAEQAVAETQQRLQMLVAERATPTDPAADADPAVLAERIQDRIQSLEHELQAATDKQKALKTERERLAAEKGKLEDKVGELQQAKAKSDRTVASERDRLKQKVVDLQQKLKKSGKLITISPSGEATEADQPESTAPETSGSFDLDAFMSRLGIGMKRERAAVGGPYVALGSGKVKQAPIDPEAAATLRVLPLSAPLDHYTLESGFGGRVDPFNGHRAMHTGLDLSAAYRSPVYSTSAGQIVFAGYAAGYGKMVEIDHGHGIHTRYGPSEPADGQCRAERSEARDGWPAGLFGAQHRPHVHYEVLVNGAPQDPARFLAAGRSVALVKDGE